jgi:hypothetical protein
MDAMELLNLPPLELGDVKQPKRGLTITLLKGGPVRCLLGPKGTFPCQAPFAPSAFEEDSARKHLSLSIGDPAIVEKLDALEKPLAGQGWISCIKPAKGDYLPLLRLKFPSECRVFDANGEPCALPDPWVRQKANAMVVIKGVYASAVGRGLIIEASHLQLAPDDDAPEETNPFV